MSGELLAASIVICTRNRADSLARTLDSLCALDRDGLPDVELVVVDNGSTDATRAVLDRARQRLPFPLTVVTEHRKGLSNARNAGVRAASTPLILMTDDDCLPERDWLATTLRLFGGDPDQVIGGAAPDVVGEGQERIWTGSVAGMPRRLAASEIASGLIMGANLAFGRTVFDRLGGFDHRLGAGSPCRSAEDHDFLHRAWSAGVPVRFHPGSVVHHDHRRIPEDLSRVMYGYAVGQGALALKHLLKGDPFYAKVVLWSMRSVVKGSVTGRLPVTRPFAFAAALLHGAASYAFGPPAPPAGAVARRGA